MDWFNAIAVLVIPFALFGVFAAIGVYLVRTSKELGLRIVGYTVVVVFGLMAVTLPPYVYVSSNAPCYNPKGVKVPCDGTTAVLFVINPDMERADHLGRLPDIRQGGMLQGRRKRPLLAHTGA